MLAIFMWIFFRLQQNTDPFPSRLSCELEVCATMVFQWIEIIVQTNLQITSTIEKGFFSFLLIHPSNYAFYPPTQFSLQPVSDSKHYSLVIFSKKFFFYYIVFHKHGSIWCDKHNPNISHIQHCLNEYFSVRALNKWTLPWDLFSITFLR